MGGPVQVSEVGGHVNDVQLRLTERLDREQVSDYNLTVTAVSGGGAGRAPMSAQLTVHIVVVDVNDCSPSFDHVEFFVEVREDVAPGTVRCRDA